MITNIKSIEDSKDGYYDFTISYEWFGLPSGILLTSPVFDKKESCEKHLEQCKRQVLLMNLDKIYMKGKDNPVPELERLQAGIRYFHENNLSLKEIKIFVVKLEGVLNKIGPPEWIDVLLRFCK